MYYIDEETEALKAEGLLKVSWLASDRAEKENLSPPDSKAGVQNQWIGEKPDAQSTLMAQDSEFHERGQRSSETQNVPN